MLTTYFLALIIALAPLPYGSADLVWIAILCSLLSLCAATAQLHTVKPIHLRLVAPVFACALVYAAVVALQLTPSVPFGGADAIWAGAAGILRAPVDGRLAVSAFQPWVSLGPPLTLFLSFVCGFFAGIEQRGAKTVLIVAASSGTAAAVASIGLVVWDYAEAVLSIEGASLRIVTGPFVNRNTAASYFGSCALLCFTFALREFRGRFQTVRLPLMQFARAVVEEPIWKLALALGGFATCMTATFMTQSRAGILCTLLVLVLCCALLSYRSFAGRSRLYWSSVTIVLLVGGFLAEIWGAAVAYRIGAEGLIDFSRWEVYRSTVAMIVDRPLFGAGLGTFGDVFPAYRSELLPTTNIWNFAHSTPLELAAEMGLLVTSVTILVWLYIFAQLIRGTLSTQRDVSMPLAGLGVGLIGTLHSCVDFTIQIPGYGIVFAAVVGAAFAQSTLTKDRAKLS
jgi:hypothetical protein